ncbi:hypothetical protein [Duganella violaceipulchra]|uniref:Uncharacterized protein n=1 Tax=Duganella violaceipulchra TaxID=2849652 RepID=A0AA41HIC1_9BURK|nr:hypothetical protein [Duganella violaceicalia]MBV6324696.1 hypothetical protein [Duganella violaceicalia]MCP2009858.1 hypothetical protein [Duganella violaceicalia]
MKLLSTSEFSVRLIGSPFGEEMPRSELIVDGKPTGKVIDGAVLEAAIRWQDLLLVLVTDNIMHEETLRVYLLDTNFEVVDSAWLGSMYATGVFSLLELQPPNKIRFLFFGGTDWTLELLNEQTFALPFSEPRGVHRPLKFHRRFKISGNPQPDGG